MRSLFRAPGPLRPPGEDALHIPERPPECLQTHEHVVHYVRGLFYGPLSIVVRERCNELGRFFPDLFETQVPVLEQFACVALGVKFRPRGSVGERCRERAKGTRTQAGCAEAGGLSRVARRSGRDDPGENSVAIAVWGERAQAKI
jgi:hypothetical protein